MNANMGIYSVIGLIGTAAFVHVKHLTETNALAIPLGFRRSDDDSNEVPPPLIPLPAPAPPAPPDPNEDPYELFKKCMAACNSEPKQAAFCSLLYVMQREYYGGCKQSKGQKLKTWTDFCANVDLLVH